MKKRAPAVAGTFYPSSASKLNQILDNINAEIKSQINYDMAEKKIIGGILPHAGYAYSGLECMSFFEILRHSQTKYDTIIILHPNHNGIGPAISTDDNDSWQTPLGDVELDKEMIKVLEFPVSNESHKLEHSAEVIVPFLQKYLNYQIKIIPLSFLKQDLPTSRLISQRITEVNTTLKRNLLVLASSDFSHFVKPETGRSIDLDLIQHIINFKSKEFESDIHQLNASVCGYGPIMSLIEYGKNMEGDLKAILLKFGNSNKRIPSDTVVDYAAILFYVD